MTAGEPAETARARIIVRVADSVADLDSETARRMLDELGILRTPRKLADYLGRVPDALTHPEVLARPSADVPPGRSGWPITSSRPAMTRSPSPAATGAAGRQRI